MGSGCFDDCVRGGGFFDVWIVCVQVVTKVGNSAGTKGSLKLGLKP